MLKTHGHFAGLWHSMKPATNVIRIYLVGPKKMDAMFVLTGGPKQIIDRRNKQLVRMDMRGLWPLSSSCTRIHTRTDSDNL